MNLAIFLLRFKTWWWWVMTPPYIRQQIQLAWGQAIMQGQEWQRMAFFDGYMAGNIQPSPADYSTSATYTTGMRVVYWINGGGAYYGDNGVYECISLNPDGSNNAGFSNKPPIVGNIAPDVIPGSITTTAQALTWLSQYYWVKVCPYPIGAYQRTSFSAQKLLYEYALNAWFHTTFRQPVAGQSDIYIPPNNTLNNQFFMSQNSKSSFMMPNTVRNVDAPVVTKYMTKNFSFTAQYNFSIYVPIAVYNNLSPNAGLRQGIIRSFADKLCPAGATYNVLTY